MKCLMSLSLCLALFVGCSSDKPGEDGAVKAPASTPVFSLTWSEYPSWSVFGVANELGILNGEEGQMSELEQKYGVDVVLKEADYDTCIQYYGTGTVDAACLTNMDTLSPSLGRPARGILPTSTSAGADAVLSVEGATLVDLKGKKVYGLDKSVSEYLFVRAIEEAGLNPADFEFVGMDPFAASQALQTDSPNVKSICVWNPFKMSTLDKRAEAVLVVDSKVIPGEIVDMVVVGEDSMAKEGSAEFCACICEAYYKVCQLLNDPATRDKTLVALGAKFSDLNAEQMAVCTTETAFYDTPDKGIALFDGTNTDGSKLTDTMVRVVKFCVDKQICDSEPTVTFGGKTDGEFNFDSSFMKQVK